MIGNGISNSVGAARKVATGGTAPSKLTDPVVTGTGIVSYTLTATPGTYSGSPAPTISRQWYRGASPIAGATGLTYPLVASDSGQSIKFRETADNGIGSPVVTDSNVVSVIRTVLDEYPNAAARGISFGRILKGNNTSPFLQRKSSGGTLNASYNSDGTINETALTTFLGSDDGFVPTIYEQNGSGYHATQSNAAKQAKNAIAGALQKRGSDLVGKWIDSQMTGYTKTTETISNAFSIFLKCYYTQSSNSSGSTITISSRPIPILHRDYGAVYRYESFQYEPLASISGYVSIAWVRNGSSLKVYRNGVLIGNSSLGPVGSISFDTYLSEFFGSFLTADIKTLLVYPTNFGDSDVATISNLL